MKRLKKLWQWYRARRATELRHKLKLMIFWEEIGRVRRGEVDGIENCLYRQELYAKVDAMTIDEILS